MSRATSYTLNDRMELAGPTTGFQVVEAVFALERHGFEIIPSAGDQLLEPQGVFDPPVSNSTNSGV